MEKMEIKFIQVNNDNYSEHQRLKFLWNDCIKEINGHHSKIEDDEIIEKDLKRRINNQGKRKDMHFEVFYLGSTLIGFSHFAIDLGTIYGLIEGGYGTIMGYYIIPQYRRKGYGKILYKHCEKTLKNDGAKKMYICPDPVTGEPFWSAIGFKDSGKMDPDDKLPIYIKEIE
jgi:GNAT superfamily N-acetyltransferase